MDRRTFIRAVAGGIFVAPLSSVAQSSAKTVRIGRLSPNSAEVDVPLLAAFRRGMRDLGWIDGDQFVIEPRYADGNPSRLPEFAAELVRSRVDVLLAGSNPGALAAKNATGTIPW